MIELDQLYQEDEAFRGRLSTVDSEGKRIWIFPRKPFGDLHRWRIVVSVVLLTLFFSGPWIKINGQPLLLLDFFERRFVIFGSVFWPQDTHLLIFLLLTFMVFIILFTVVFGRFWCGWTCPQTVFMEMVFRKIEYWIEGNANQQRRLEQQEWNREKMTKKGFKHFVFLLIALLVAHTVMAYLIGYQNTLDIIQSSPADRMGGFTALVVFTGLFYGVFAFMREQVCTVICPYGRLQGVLLDQKSIVVAYDHVRGEPRGKIKKVGDETQKGDCIDCSLCVQVCPTGIDIRNGTQLECVNCTACIDACNQVMDKVKKPRGLIRFDSDEGINQRRSSLLTLRTAAYSVVLMALIFTMGFLVIGRSPVDISLSRVPGSLYQLTEEGTVRNFYQAELINKSFDEMDIYLRLLSHEGSLVIPAGDSLRMESEGKTETYVFVEISREEISRKGNKITLGIERDGEIIKEKQIRFPSPAF